MYLYKICSGLSTKKTAYFAQVSKTFNSAAKQSAENRIPMLIEKLNVLISNSGITGIQIPEGPFSNSIHELSVLETREKNLSNAINVLKDHNIKDINARKGEIPRFIRPLCMVTQGLSKPLITAGADKNVRGDIMHDPASFCRFCMVAKRLSKPYLPLERM